MPTTGDIAARMIAALKVSEPNLDTSVGTVARNIVDAVAESVAESSSDAYLVNYQYDIDSKVEGDLDEFVALFGMSRIPAQRAKGAVTFSRPNDSTAASTTLVIAPGTQVVALTSPLVYVQTIVGATLTPGQLTVDIPVQAVSAGPQGNVAANLVSSLVNPTPGVTSATNAAALTGGSAPETDDALRTRFKQTVFRNIAGTSAMYQATSQEVLSDVNDPSTRVNSAANVVGSSKWFREQIQLVSGTGSSSLQAAAYIYTDNVFFGPDIDNDQILQQGVQFNFTPTNPTDRSNASAVVTSLNPTTVPDGVYDLEFEYVPQWSRNDPANTRFSQGPINNRIDIYVNGQNPDVASQTVIFSNALTFSASTSSPYYINRWTQSNAASATPTAGWIYVPLAFGPIISIPSTIIVGATTYTYNVDYNFAFQNDAFGLAANSPSGLSWKPTGAPANNTAIPLTYTYNRAIRDTQAAIRNWRLLGTDAQVHTGRQILLKFCFAIVYDRRFDVVTVNTNINSALSSFITTLGFNQILQVSDILNVVHNVPGVDNVRFLNSSDNPTTYAMTRMSQFGNVQLSVYNSSGRAVDLYFADHEYPVFHSTVLVQKSPNTFGTL